MDIGAYKDLAVTTGSTVNIDVSGLGALISQFRLTGTQTLVSDYELTPSGTPVKNQIVVFLNEAAITLDGNDFIVFGKTVPTSLAAKNWTAVFIYNGSAWIGGFVPTADEDGWLQGSDIETASVPLTVLESSTSAYIIVYNGSGVPVAVAVSGDIAISNAGVVSISSGVIINADINASAAIALSKLAAGTDGYIVVCNGAGVPVYVASSGDVTVDNTGAFTIGAGKVLVSMLEASLQTEVITAYLAFDNAAKIGDYKIYIPFACDVTHLSVATVGTFTTDDATITPKNNAGTVMKLGAVNAVATITPTTIGTVVNQVIDTDNSFTAGQTLTLTLAKTTADGQALVSITLTRT